MYVLFVVFIFFPYNENLTGMQNKKQKLNTEKKKENNKKKKQTTDMHRRINVVSVLWSKHKQTTRKKMLGAIKPNHHKFPND